MTNPHAPPAAAKRTQEIVAQTLHGYDQGHRLLAKGGDLRPDELAVLDRLSDLSGYLPLDATFDRYHTGFPCGRYYAFACTWPDPVAIRAGTVLTHTLLIPLRSIEDAADPWCFSRWHRRPASAADRVPYEVALAIEPSLGSEPHAPTLDHDRARDVLVLWFGQRARPILWVEERRPDDVYRFLFRMLWPEWRRTFAFCTFALQVRYIDKRPFDALALPTSARGSFRDHARSAAWWQEGMLTSAALCEFRNKPWVQAILDSDGDVLRDARRYCLTESLPLPVPPQIPAYIRFRELESAAKERLTAARARADLLFQVFGTIEPTHPLSRVVLSDLLARQPEAPLAPQPLWEIVDFLNRPEVRALTDADPSFEAGICDLLRSDLGRRLEGLSEAAAEGLQQLLTATARPAFRAVVLEAIQRWVRSGASSKGESSVLHHLWARSLERREPGLLGAVLEPLQPLERKRLIDETPESQGMLADPARVAAILQLARQFVDPLLAFAVLSLNKGPLEGLREATRVILTEERPRMDLLASVFAFTSPSDRLAWSLEVTEPAIAVAAASRGAEAAKALSMDVQSLVVHCTPAPNGPRLLFSYLVSMPYQEAMEAARSVGDLGFEMLRLSLSEQGDIPMLLAREAMKSISEDRLLDPALADALPKGSTITASARVFIREMESRLLGAIVSGALSSEGAALWLRARAVQEAFGDTRYWPLYGDATRPTQPSCLPNMSRAITAFLGLDSSPRTDWIPSLLQYLLKNPPSQSLADAANDLIAILRAPWDPEHRIDLCIWILHAVRQSRWRAGHMLVEISFPEVYPRLARGSLGYRRSRPLDFRGDGWDLAKAWRHWLIDTWVGAAWPTPAFLRCLGQDEELFRRLLYRASRSRDGRAFLKRLAEELPNEPELVIFWQTPLKKVQGDPDFLD